MSNICHISCHFKKENHAQKAMTGEWPVSHFRATVISSLKGSRVKQLPLKNSKHKKHSGVKAGVFLTTKTWNNTDNNSLIKISVILWSDVLLCCVASEKSETEPNDDSLKRRTLSLCHEIVVTMATTCLHGYTCCAYCTFKMTYKEIGCISNAHVLHHQRLQNGLYFIFLYMSAESRPDLLIITKYLFKPAPTRQVPLPSNPLSCPEQWSRNLCVLPSRCGDRDD